MGALSELRVLLRGCQLFSLQLKRLMPAFDCWLTAIDVGAERWTHAGEARLMGIVPGRASLTDTSILFHRVT